MALPLLQDQIESCAGVMRSIMIVLGLELEA